MLNLFITLFAITLFYFSISERFRTYSVLIAVQGILLFGMAFLELKQVNLANFIFIAAETLIFKTFAVPLLLYRIINRTGVYKVHSKAFPSFYILILTMLGLLLSIILTNVLYSPNVDSVYLAIALFTMFTGVILIVTHKRIFSHMIGFLVIENAVFMFSLAVGSEMPMLINIAILLDIFVSVLIIGVVINRVGEHYSDLGSENLTRLKH
jgi:hydrogenase-4 component E